MVFYCSKITRRFAHAFFNLCCVVGILLSMYSIVNPRWYGAETHRGELPLDPTTIDGGLSVSPWYSCSRTSGIWQCEEFAISGLAPFGTCKERSKTYVRDNIYAIRAMIIITGVFLSLSSVASSAIAGLGPTYVKSGTSALIGLTLIAVLSNIVGIVISAVFFKSKLYCDGGYCALLRQLDPTIETCDEAFYHGALCYYVGLICPVLALITAIYLRASAVVVTAVARPPPLANRRGRHFTDVEMAAGGPNQSNFHSRTQSNASAYAYSTGVVTVPASAGGQYPPGFYPNNKLGASHGSIDAHNFSHANNNYNQHQQQILNSSAGAQHLPLQSSSSPVYSRGVSPRNLNASAGNANINNNSVAPTAANQSAAQEPSFHGQSGSAEEAPAAEVTFQPPEGDWEWDPNSNMYWSESQYLFLNPNDGHFFDPNSEQWYNPETEVWYS